MVGGARLVGFAGLKLAAWGVGVVGRVGAMRPVGVTGKRAAFLKNDGNVSEVGSTLNIEHKFDVEGVGDD